MHTFFTIGPRGEILWGYFLEKGNRQTPISFLIKFLI